MDPTEDDLKNMTPEERKVYDREVAEEERASLIALGCFGCRYYHRETPDSDPGPNPKDPVGDYDHGFPCGICDRNEKCPTEKTVGDNYEMEVYGP